MSATTATLSHVYPIGSRVNERGRLEIGGCDAVELAHEFGSPAYVVSEHDMRARARAFRRQHSRARMRNFAPMRGASRLARRPVRLCAASSSGLHRRGSPL